MNLFHRWYCNSKGWAEQMQQYLPRMLGDADLGDDLLEVGPGPGVTTDILKTRVPHVTAVEIDHKLATKLQRRFEGSNVTVIEGDATSMELPDGRFSGAVSFTMLHHVPSEELQDRLLAEVGRVLRPGGVFLGSDSVPSLRWNLYHVFDTRVPIDPDRFGARLERAGFAETSVYRFPGGFGFRAKKPTAG
jgi:SAM-dependent methyltransferase